MMQQSLFSACLTLLLAAAPAAAQAQARADEWVSYRDAYRAMVLFDKYGGPKQLLQNALQVQPKEPGMLGEGLQLVLEGRTVQTSLALDATGRGTLPLLKAAYDENAVLAPNRALGGFAIRPRVTLALRADNTYDVADLRAGCEQALGFARHADASARGRTCAGVRIVFAKGGEPASLRLRGAAGEQALTLAPGAAFTGDADADFPVATVRFAAQAGGQVVTYKAPLAIVPVFE